jgi:hypothetical protein
MFIYVTGIRNFANKTFASYWRKSRGRTGESSLNSRQLANFHEIHWRKSSELSSIGEFPRGGMTRVE